MNMEIIPHRLKSQWAALIHDALMVPVAWFLAVWLRYNLGSIPPAALENTLASLVIILPVQISTFVAFGLYRGIWRFASLPDIVRILKAVVVGVVICTASVLIFSINSGIPRSIPVIYSILLVMLLSGPRLLYRWLKDHHLYRRPGQRVVIVGAGKAGEMLARDIMRNSTDSFLPVVFVDDKLRRMGRELHGIPIVGPIDELPQIVEKHNIDLIMLAIPSASSKRMRRIVSICEQTNIPFRSVPQLKDLMSGSIHLNDLHDVSIEDLLGRDPVSLDWPAICDALSGKTILVTGGGGSIGSELSRQLAKLKPARLIIVDLSELNLYSIEMELKKSFQDLKLHCYLGDVTDRVFIEDILIYQRPDVVFHAAAYKHVPMLEPQIRQALRNNVLGTRYVAESADKAGCKTFVLVSTDKAVNPANVMGASKRIAEIFCQNLNAHSTTNYITVRFGNVLGSTGSVIPLFKKQIAAGGPVTVTDPRMERYFMTIPEASQLIMQTVVLGKGGEIFVLDMGEPVKISYLAEQMIRLSGKVPGEDIDIEYIGLRPGEKLYEELFHEKEQLEGTGHKKVFLSQHRKVDWQWLIKMLDEIEVACDKLDENMLRNQLNLLVPEYTEVSNSSANSNSADVVFLRSAAKHSHSI
jgi:FlaA1/EpsC-like NDP-sugar epimerase